MANLIEIILQAKDKASSELKKVASSLSNIGSSASNAQKGMGSLSASASQMYGTWLKVGAGITAVTVAMKEVYEFSEQAAQITRLKQAGEDLAKSMGSNMDDIVEAVRDASLGTVADMDIIASANKAMMLGVSANAKELANLMEIAALRGRAMGLSTTQAFDDIVRGVGRMSPLILDNLGIIVDAESTYGSYAESLGKVASELSSTEKRQALLNRVLEEGNIQLAKVGGLVDDQAAAYERNAASMKNATDQLKLWYAENIHLGTFLNRVIDPQYELDAVLGKVQNRLLSSGVSLEKYNKFMREFGTSHNIAIDVMKAYGYIMTQDQYNTKLLGNSLELAGERTYFLGGNQDILNARLATGEATTLRFANAMQVYGDRSLAAAQQSVFGFSLIGASAEQMQNASQQYQNAYQNMVNAQQNLTNVQQNYYEGVGSEVVQLMGTSMYEGGERYRAGLQALDDELGTNYIAELEHKEAVSAAVAEYSRTGDVVAFKETLGALADKELPSVTEEAAAAADEAARLVEMMQMLANLEGTYEFRVLFDDGGGPASPAMRQDIVSSVKANRNNNVVKPKPTLWAQGGSFTVPPGYPNDSYIPPIRLTSGERVDITPYGKSKAGGGTTVVVNYSPAVALGDRYEAEAVLAPMIQRALRGMV